jgi:hypothetical protein
MKKHTLKFWKNPKQKFEKKFSSLILLFEFVHLYKSNNFNVSVTLS